MSKWRRSAKKDGNQDDIVKELEQLGVIVELGHDDILCYYKGIWLPIEIKDPARAMAKCGRLYKGELTKEERIRQNKFNGKWPVCYSSKEVMEFFNQILEEIGVSQQNTGEFWW